MRILTIDLEEWFHILDNKTTKSVNEWKNYECRIHNNTERILSLLRETNKKATFFCLGWIAEQYPEIITKIVNDGHEIGSHTRMHQLAYEQDRYEFRRDVEHSIKTLEDLTGQKVKYFRAPGFSVTTKNLWAFEVLYELGIEIDSSVFPAERAHGGIPNFGVACPLIIEYQGVKLKEFPVNTISILNKNIVFSGGGYFRLFPYLFINKWSKKSPYIMTYIHPRDFDYKQPNIPGLSPFRRFKTHVGLKKAEPKFRKWLTEYDFINLGVADKLINWDTVRTIQL